MTTWNPDDLPSHVSFEGMAVLLRRYDLDPNATGSSVRYVSRTRKDWPVGEEGEGKPYTYTQASNARMMPPVPVLELYQESGPPGGRGPDKQPRKPRGGAR
ncbi:hypothetical protein ACH4TX_41695 [Streptomyces sp. NPDC021098]|uniref:hypothetical protein n=1 Tax=unclassified Streptomyces TaxID=2593676 RepID=UPI0037A67854